MMIRIQTDDVDVAAMIAAAKVPGTGAVVVFDGIVRDDGITEMELEAYEDVAVAGLEKIAVEATERFGLLHVSIVHRIGRLAIGENIVVIVVSAGHRHEAYDGSRFIIDELKHTVPIWKKELTRDGGRWVDGEHGHGAGKPQE
ncbi:MAG: molybdopterin biosynthesis protein MoeE [Methanomicrobiales archaeon HGW-Methanomicrobiales-3]|jgi:molybdopterin synthase catalytic subunit|nr:MAG: molybdopterin biosynthesis protein MoeE [Methanomicrobiales archaeon HGW-Methanomicrobiales-3]